MAVSHEEDIATNDRSLYDGDGFSNYPWVQAKFSISNGELMFVVRNEVVSLVETN